MHPSGEQVELRYGDQRAVVVESGGGLRAYDVAGRPVLDGYADDGMVSAGRGQLLIPWPNRLHDGRYDWDGQEHELPLDDPAEGVALHGLTRWRSWRPEQRSDSAVTMALRLLPQPGYPFALELSVRYELDEGGLSVATTATNVGAAAAPYGTGMHPYLTVGTDAVDDALLRLPARTRLTPDADQVQVGWEAVAGTAFDFRSPRRIGDTVLDDTFTDLERGPDSRAEVVLSDPAANRRVTLWLDAGYPYLQVFSGETVPEPERRRKGLAVEPMTCPPDAFRTGQDVLRLEPGDAVTHRWGLRAGSGSGEAGHARVGRDSRGENRPQPAAVERIRRHDDDRPPLARSAGGALSMVDPEDVTSLDHYCSSTASSARRPTWTTAVSVSSSAATSSAASMRAVREAASSSVRSCTAAREKNLSYAEQRSRKSATASPTTSGCVTGPM